MESSLEDLVQVKPPLKLEGWISKESPSRFRQAFSFIGLGYQRRWVTLDSAKLFWSAVEGEPNDDDSKASFVDLMSNEVKLVDEEDQMISLQASNGQWARGDFTGADEDRVFRFDATGSDHSKFAWITAITDHIKYAVKVKLKLLSKVPLVKRLPQTDALRMAAACVGVDFQKQQEVVTQGDVGDEFYVILSGEANVLIADGSGEKKPVATLKAGDYFGENALRTAEPRAATVVANTSLSAFKITRDRFNDLGLNGALRFPVRKAVGIANAKPPTQLKPEPKTAEEEELIAQALRGNTKLNSLFSMDEARIKQVMDVARKEKVEAGKEVITEGDLNADSFYIVIEGAFDVFKKSEAKAPSDEKAETDKTGEGGEADKGESPESPPDGEGKAESSASAAAAPLMTVGPGGSFGELALLYLEPRAATVIAKEKSSVFTIIRPDFKEILMKVSEAKVAEYMQHLEGVSSLSCLLTDERKELAENLVEVQFTKDDTIIEQGAFGSTFYILFDGEVMIIKNQKHMKTLAADSKQGVAQYFGEAALLDNEVRAATVQVSSAEARALAVDRDTFEGILGPLKDIMEHHRKAGDKRGRMQGKFKQAALQALAIGQKDMTKRLKIYKRDLKKIGLLGCGGFGVVELVEHKVSGEVYALKGLSKGFVVKSGMQNNVMHEKDVQISLNCQFIVRLWETYNDSQRLYFLLEPALGGELYATYMRKSFHGSVKHAQYYGAGVVFAFEYLHTRNIIYRDLKPENLLLTEKGHVKLTDMGLAKVVHSKTYTACGTPDYFAPEIIKSSGHNRAVDWWEFGILLFELLSGHPPFESADPMEIYAKVCNGIERVNFPLNCKGIVGDLIRQLCKRQPSERLPMRAGGTKNIKTHAWFSSTKFDWEAMRLLQMPPPYKPEVKSKKDLQNFPSSLPNMPRQIDYQDDGSGWDKDFATSTEAPPEG